MANLREALVDLEKFLGMNIDCDSLLLFYGACKKAGVDLNKFMEKLAGNPTLLKNFNSILDVVIAPLANIFRINRSTPFDPVPLLGTGASFWHGPKDGKGLKGEIEQDTKSMALTEIDLWSIRFKAYIPEGESLISGENRIMAIKTASDTALDPQIGQSLYEEDGQKGLRWLYDQTGIKWMEFLGQPLRNAFGDRLSLVLYRLVDGSWGRGCVCLGNVRSASGPAAVVSNK